MPPSAAESRPSGGARMLAYAVTLACVVAVTAPAAWPTGRDSFPRSSYPMFAQPRGSVMTLATVLGVRRDGVRVPLSPEAIAGARWVNMAARLVGDAVRGSAAARDALCESVARRVRASNDAALVRIEVVQETFDTVAYFVDTSTPRHRHTLAHCPVVP